MAVASNKNTQQTPVAMGKTGAQSIKFIPCPRVYIKAVDSITAAPCASYYAKSAGVTPAGWTDLGIVDGFATVAYTKELKEVRTGVDNILRLQYIGQKTATMEFNLAQFDDNVFENISGLTASTIISGSSVAYYPGSEDLITKALKLVLVNKLDGKEMHLYNPAAQLNFNIIESGDFVVLQCQATFGAFTASGQASESLFDVYFTS